MVTQEVPQEPETPAQQAKPDECGANCVHHRAVRLSWARPLKRVFELDLAHCPNCGGELKIIAATRAAGPGCVRVLAGPMAAARRQGITRRRRQGEAHFGWAINAQQLASRSQPASKDRFRRVGRCVPPLFCRIWGAVGKEKGV